MWDLCHVYCKFMYTHAHTHTHTRIHSCPVACSLRSCCVVLWFEVIYIHGCVVCDCSFLCLFCLFENKQKKKKKEWTRIVMNHKEKRKQEGDKTVETLVLGGNWISNLSGERLGKPQILPPLSKCWRIQVFTTEMRVNVIILSCQRHYEWDGSCIAVGEQFKKTQ